MRQSGSIEDYMAKFELIMHSILAHNLAFDLVFITARFVDGL